MFLVGYKDDYIVLRLSYKDQLSLVGSNKTY